MRVLDTETGRFAEIDPRGFTKYSILSHTWDPDGEQSYQDVREIQRAFDRRIKATFLWACAVTSHHLLVSLPLFLHLLTTYSLLSFWRSQPASTHSTQFGFIARWAEDLRWALDALCAADSVLDDPRLSDKIRRACALARAHGYRYLWIDSCCIDQTSSLELSEAVNSMYAWYRNAHVCYAFLRDVSKGDLPQAEASCFRKSRWFMRGWTLQELIAPQHVVFLTGTWQIFGTKTSLAVVIEEITGIELAVLLHQKPLSAVSVATRMSWAAHRRTTRIEDQAYSLWGIFRINMSTLYGEGNNAFSRLQEEILKRIPDQSLFAWGETFLDLSSPVDGPSPYSLLSYPRSGSFPRFMLCGDYPMSSTLEFDNRSLFARSPEDFSKSGQIVALSYDALIHRLGLSGLPIPEYTTSSYGIRTQLPLLPMSECFDWARMYNRPRWLLAILACEHSQREGHLLARVCFADDSVSTLKVLRPGSVMDYESSTPPRPEYRLFSLSRTVVQRYLHLLSSEMVYLPYIISSTPAPNGPPPFLSIDRAAGRLHIELQRLWAVAVLQWQGYDVAFRERVPQNSDKQGCYSLTISRPGDDTIWVEITYAWREDDDSHWSYATDLRASAWVVNADVARREKKDYTTFENPQVVEWGERGFPDLKVTLTAGGQVTFRLGLEQELMDYGWTYKYLLRVELLRASTDTDDVATDEASDLGTLVEVSVPAVRSLDRGQRASSSVIGTDTTIESKERGKTAHSLDTWSHTATTSWANQFL